MQVAPLRALIALLLAALALSSTGCSPRTSAGAGKLRRETPAAAVRVSSTSLQEVAPPGAVAEATPALAGHTPMVEIVAPLNDALLPDGAWELQLRVRDWPIAQASDTIDPNDRSGHPSLGPHLVVQLDQAEPVRVAAEAAATADNGGIDVRVAMPPLQPGSHRLTVYAARPWGEAVKSPGAVRQIHLHRVARNPTQLPVPGTAQLIVASPDALQREEPVLIDWLLLDAPLQHLRDDDARWRLRVSVNGDSVLVDRQTPLWLKGFHRGSNAVQLELLDDHGEPLNAPFNSVVREVRIGGGPPPSWQRSSLSADALAQLNGDNPAPAATPPAPAVSAEESTPQEPPAEETSAAVAASKVAGAEVAGTDSGDAEESSHAEDIREDDIRADDILTGPATEEANPTEEPTSTEAASPGADPDEEEPAAMPASMPDVNSLEDAAEPAAQPETTAEDRADVPAPEPMREPRVSASSSLGGSARDQVNADGSLLQPQRRGPLAGLREKLGG